MTPGSRFDNPRKPKKPYPAHLVLLAYNNIGYKNLMKLSSLSHLEGYYYVPRIDKELLRQYNDGLLCLTGCLEGEIPRLIRKRSPASVVYTAIEEYLSIFGDRLYLELQDNGYKQQKKVNEKLVRLGRHFNIPVVATNNCHYLRKKDSQAYRILTAIRRGKRIEKIHGITDDLYLKSPAEMETQFSNCPAAIKNTLRIAEMCEVSIETEMKHCTYPSLSGDVDAVEDLESLVYEGEVPVISVINIDNCEKQRDEIMLYSKQILGADKVAHIGTSGVMDQKEIIRSVARVFGISRKEIDELLKNTEFGKHNIKQAIRKNGYVHDLYINRKGIEAVLDNSSVLESLVIQIVTNESEIIIADRPLIELVPLYMNEYGEAVTQYDRTMLEKIGIARVNFSVRGLSKNDITKCIADGILLGDKA